MSGGYEEWVFLVLTHIYKYINILLKNFSFRNEFSKKKINPLSHLKVSTQSCAETSQLPYEATCCDGAGSVYEAQRCVADPRPYTDLYIIDRAK